MCHKLILGEVATHDPIVHLLITFLLDSGRDSGINNRVFSYVDNHGPKFNLLPHFFLGLKVRFARARSFAKKGSV